MSDFLKQLAVSWHEGRAQGIYSVCSAHPWVLEAAMEQAREDETHLLIEATSNQVNHEGGYTGMRPIDFRSLAERIAAEKKFDATRLILGGDHLGPNPWKKQPADDAMRAAKQTVAEYARAGFKKIHLDASMACGDETGPLPEEIIATRAAALCAIAEEASDGEKPVYVIGTEVPTPGGATESLTHIEPTSRAAVTRTLSLHRRIFEEKGLAHVWPRVVALVVQPGVEFNHMSVVDYEPAKAAHLTDWLRETPGLVFEAHSTDYQRAEAYQALLRDGFVILKVGPALTFALREALTALSLIEAELTSAERCSRLIDVIETAMLADQSHWEHYYKGDEHTKRLLRRYSYSDRERYYWGDANVKKAVETLDENLARVEIPETMLSLYLPEEYEAVRAGRLQVSARSLTIHRIRRALHRYARLRGGELSP
jgi:D-tagatose-1,6-bisphosphate aldolase subunit GatZ/KbaZ